MKKTIISLVVIFFIGCIILTGCSRGKESVEMAAKWTTLSSGVPKMLEALQSRVDMLSQSKKLPANLSSAKFAEVKSGLASAKDEWNKAAESYKAGKISDAVSVGTSAKDKLVKAMESLGMTVPAVMK